MSSTKDQINSLLVAGEKIITIVENSHDLTTARLAIKKLNLAFTNLRIILYAEKSLPSIIDVYFLDEIELRTRQEFWNTHVEIRPKSGKKRRLTFFNKRAKDIIATVKHYFSGYQWGYLNKDTIENYKELKQSYFEKNPPKKFHISGLADRSVYVTDHTVQLTKQISVSSSAREKSIPINQITSIEIKAPSTIPGYIQFSIAGSVARDSAFSLTGGTFDALVDENSVVFDNAESYEKALKIKSFVENYSKPTAEIHATNSSVADEILKFKTLCDQGVISKKEFSKKKEQLLGL